MMQGFNLNSLHTSDIEAVSCPVCEAPAGAYCVDLQTPLRLRRIDYHMDRKWRAAQEKENLKVVGQYIEGQDKYELKPIPGQVDLNPPSEEQLARDVHELGKEKVNEQSG